MIKLLFLVSSVFGFFVIQNDTTKDIVGFVDEPIIATGYSLIDISTSSVKDINFRLYRGGSFKIINNKLIYEKIARTPKPSIIFDTTVTQEEIK